MTQTKIINTLIKGLPLAALSATVLAAHPSDAAIIGIKGQVEITDTPFWLLDNYYATPREKHLLAFDEEQNVVLPRDVEISDPTNWDKLSGLDTIKQVTRVNSHFIYLWNPTPSEGRIEASATITFDTPIIGLMGDRRLIVPTNDIFFPDDRGVSRIGTLDEPSLPRDIATITGDRGNVLEVSFTTHSAMDPIRVITQVPTAPEPLTILGTGTAIGFAPLLQRAYSKKKNKGKNKD